jgi:hypothetical protein
MPVWTDPPPDPERDLWWAAQRLAPDELEDYVARHQRGHVRLPYDLGPGQLTGAIVAAWVCCDPECGGVELSERVLHINHFCCGRDTYLQRRCKAAGGAYRGPFTAHWEPTP